jgi:hypothetical protein
LALVIAPGREIDDSVDGWAVTQYVNHRAVNSSIAATAALVCKSARITKTRKHQTVSDTHRGPVVSGEPDN